ncbi:MAG: TIR domain-containing protein [Pseudomonas sp.]
MSDMEVPPTVFISYSWESDAHKSWVRELAERLTLNGVNARLDQWHIAPGQSLTQFMEVEAQGSDFTLVICTKDYCRKSLARAGGVGYEQQIITGRIVGGLERIRLIPIVRDGEFAPGPECSVPPQFSGIYAVDMRDDSLMDQRIEDLLRAIFKEPALIQPPIGSRPSFGADIAAQNNVTVSRRLAVLGIEGWHLISGVASNERAPETFHIPEESERYSLDLEASVKLHFEFLLLDDEGNDELFGERMWVQVKGHAGPYILGALQNNPACSDEQDNLRVGDMVVFLPEHVIDIWGG